MALYSVSVEYGLHCLLHLVGGVLKATSLDLAEFQGISPTYTAKLFTQLKIAGLVVAHEGAHGGFCLARPASEITVLDVVEALEGHKPLFQCREVRRNCALFEDEPPLWAVKGPCGIHAVMLEAEQSMKRSLARHTLADIAQRVADKAPIAFVRDATAWFSDRKSKAKNRASLLKSKKEIA